MNYEDKRNNNDERGRDEYVKSRTTEFFEYRSIFSNNSRNVQENKSSNSTAIGKNIWARVMHPGSKCSKRDGWIKLLPGITR